MVEPELWYQPSQVQESRFGWYQGWPPKFPKEGSMSPGVTREIVVGRKGQAGRFCRKSSPGLRAWGQVPFSAVGAEQTVWT